MSFWIFMLIMNLLIPIALIAFGFMFLKKPPQEINTGFGYRTTMSMKNKDTWDFAHRYCGRWWLFTGCVLIIPTVAIMVLQIDKGINTIGIVGGVTCGIQMLCVIFAIFPTEQALKKNFDSKGKRRVK